MIEPLSPFPRRFTVVVGVDFSPSSDRALATAQMLCALSGSCRLHAVHALPEAEVALIATARTRLASRVRLAGFPEESEITLHVQTGITHEVITDVARDYGADLILVGFRRSGGSRRLPASSVSGHVTRDAPCTVITVRLREAPAAEMVEAGCPACTAATTTENGIHGRCARHRRGHRARTYTDLGDLPRDPGNTFSP